MPNKPLKIRKQPKQQRKALALSSPTSPQTSIAGSGNPLAFQTLTKRILTRTAQRNWEELPEAAWREAGRLLQIHIEPALKASRAKKEARKFLTDTVHRLQSELNGLLVPTGGSAANFNFDHLYRRARALQKELSVEEAEIARLERMLAREQRRLKSDEEYLSKLERSFRQVERSFGKLIREGHSIPNDIDVKEEADAFYSSSTLPKGAEKLDFENYDPEEDEDLKKALGDLLSGKLDVFRTAEELKQLEEVTMLV